MSFVSVPFRIDDDAFALGQSLFRVFEGVTGLVRGPQDGDLAQSAEDGAEGT